MMNINF